MGLLTRQLEQQVQWAGAGRAEADDREIRVVGPARKEHARSMAAQAKRSVRAKSWAGQLVAICQARV